VTKALKIFIPILLALLLMPSLDAQSKRKRKSKKNDKKKSSVLRNAYQDMTARYNGYFNAKLILGESILALKESNKDDFNETLPLFDFAGGDAASSTHAQMNKIIEKCSADIILHPNSKWVDDCYLLLGKARFFKGEYEEALVNFNYIERKFGRSLRKGAKQKKGKVKRNRKMPGFDLGLKVDGPLKGDSGKLIEDIKEERKQNKADKEKARKEKEKDNKALKKERAKDKKKLQKEREKEKKRKEKERARVKKMSKEKRRAYMQEQKKIKAEKAAGKLAEDAQKEKDDVAEAAKKEAEEKAALEAEEKKKEEEAAAAKKEAEEKTTEKEDELGQYDLVDSELDKVSYDKNFMGFMRHRAAKFEGAVWKARTLLSMDRPDEAIALLEDVRSEGKMPKKLRGEMNALYASAFMQNEDPANAYAALSEAIKSTKGKKKRARLHFVQAQLSHEKAEYDLALKSYKRVLKSKPSFEMEFHSRLQIADTKMRSGEYTAAKVIRDLEKMLKEEKYKNNQDEIYFMMANIAIEGGDVEQAMEYLAQSASNSTVNNDMKARAFLALAELHFEKENYLLSSYYYDSTANILPKDYPDIEDIVSRKEILSELAGHIRTVEYEDSLQRLAQLPEDERNRIIDDIIENLEQQIEDERLAAEAAANEVLDAQNNSAGGGTGTWYFYNDAAKSMGYNQFVSLWGNRSLSDDWRRGGDGGGADFSNRSESEAEQARFDLAQSGKLSREAFLADIPFSKEAVVVSNEKIKDALFGSGNIYKDKLENDPKAIEAFTSLNDRFPDNQHSIPAAYSLYLLHQKAGNTAKAEQYKNYILANDKSGEYKAVLEDPAAFAKRDKEAERFYEETYKLYLEEQYDAVIKRKSEAVAMFASNSTLLPQFDLLDAFVVGQTEAKDNYINALKSVKDKYPSHNVGIKAAEILEYISKEAKEEKKKKKASSFVFKEKTPHYFILAFSEYVNDINQAVTKFSDHNTSKFKVERLKVTPMLLSPKNQIVLVKTFPNATKALTYFKQTRQAIPELLEGVPTNNFEPFVISKTNFAKYFKSKDTESYMEFFEENYLKD